MIKMKELLREFEYWVNEGDYKRIPYDEWRKLKKYENEEVDVEVWFGYDTGDAEINLYIPGKTFVYQTNDDSFGTFLHDQVETGVFDEPKLYQKYTTPIGINKNQSQIAINSDDSWHTLATKDIEIKHDTTISDTLTLNMNLDLKENNNMDNKLFKNFDFGPCTNNNIKASFYGLAVKNASGTYVSYDVKTDSVIDVDILNFDGGKYFYKIPVAIKDVQTGDVVIHNRVPVFVKAVEDNRIVAVDPVAGEEKSVLLTRSPFNFDFVTKVVSLFDNFAGGASADNPFGNILPLILLNDDKGSNDLLPLLFLNGGLSDFSQNPVLLYFLLSNQGNDRDNLLPLLLLNGGNFGVGKDNTSKK